MALRDVRITLRDRQTTGGSIPGDAQFGEPFVNLFDGVLRFSAVTGGGFEPSTQTNVFEVGSTLYNQKITNRLNINNNFIISGDTGLISTYQGATGGGLAGKFLSGTSAGLVLADITDIATTTDSYTTGATWSPNLLTIKLNHGRPNVSVTIDTFTAATFGEITATGATNLNTLFATTISGGTLFSGSTNVGTLFVNTISNGTNTTVGGSANHRTVNLVDSPSVNNITYSGTSTGGSSVASNVSATTAFFSAGTNLGTVIYSQITAITSSLTSTRVQPGTNTTTGGTPDNPSVNLVDSPSINNLSFSGTATGGNVFGTNVSGGTLFSGSTNVGTLFVNDVTAGTNISVGGSANHPTINVIASPTFTGLVSATGFTDSSLTAGRVVYVGASGRLVDEAGFTYDANADTLNTQHIVVGAPGQTGTSATIYGDVLVMGASISGFTSELYIEDNNIFLNYNPTASTISTSLGAGWTIQDGSGVALTDAFMDVRGTTTGVANRSFATNLNDLRIRETGTISAPNGSRVLAENDVLDGGTY